MTSQQKDLFGFAPWEADEARWQTVATVVFAGPLDGEFDYVVPDELRSDVEPGRRLRVPLGKGNRLVEAYCVRVDDRETVAGKLKTIAHVIDVAPLLSAEMLRLTKWIGDRYLCSWGQVLEAVIPAGVRAQAGTRIKSFVTLASDFATRRPEHKLSPKQQRVVEVLATSEAPLVIDDVARLAGCTTVPVHGLVLKGLLTLEKRRTRVEAAAAAIRAREANFTLNPEQTAAFAAIKEVLYAGEHATLLLHGVTGSGKTEVYIQAIQEVVRFGRQAIVMVPEISLTPQTVERFQNRFGRVAVLHSHLSDVDRHRHWESIAAGRVSVVVGARSAVFAPTPHLGLIVLDEEHETSFKQETSPRYHARQVAIERAKAEQIPLVLGSATPSLESWHRAQRGEFRLIKLPKRVNDRPLPPVQTLDLKEEARQHRGRGALSRRLREAMRKALDAGGQVILLLNRRGFSTHLQCPKCGHVLECEHCDIALTYHKTDELLLCHYCDHHRPAPTHCPECKEPGILYAGLGTQRLEAEVSAAFPDAECLRMDTDTMQAPGSHERALARFRTGEVKILLGTQMIAKGLDFPNVLLVGVVNADMALHLPDFRAAERTFQLLAQVAGRAGRGEQGGRVLVQTFTPEHPAIQLAARHDYEAFVALELPLREPLGYPPYGELVRIVVRGELEHQAADFAQHLADRLKAITTEQAAAIRILGPAPAPITKLRSKFRYNLQLQGVHEAALRTAILTLKQGLVVPDGIEWMADVDPQSML